MRSLLTPLLLVTAIIGRGQFVTLNDQDNTVTYNSTVVDLYAAAADGQMSFGAVATLNASAPKVVNVKRYELAYPAGHTENSFCWSECYNSDTTGDHPLWYAPGTVTMFPGTATPGFDAYYAPFTVTGTASFRFVWFDDNNVNDSSWVDINFHATAVGIAENVAADQRFSAFPVPSSTGRVEFTFDALRSGQQGVVEFHDALGQFVFSERMAQGQQRFVLPQGKLEPGLWFASLRVDGRVAATRRVVISER